MISMQPKRDNDLFMYVILRDPGAASREDAILSVELCIPAKVPGGGSAREVNTSLCRNKNPTHTNPTTRLHTKPRHRPD